jgi:hypothetical protein
MPEEFMHKFMHKFDIYHKIQGAYKSRGLAFFLSS